MLRSTKLFGMGAFLLITVWVAGQGGYLGWTQSCTVTVQPRHSIQQAINNAVNDDVICLSEGTFLESLSIQKNVTLQGAGSELTLLKPLGFSLAVISINSESHSELKVTISNLAVAGLIYGIEIGTHQEDRVTLTEVTARKNILAGLQIYSASKVKVIHSNFANNGIGIMVGVAGQIDLEDSQISYNRLYGLLLQGFSQVSVNNSRVFSSGDFGLVVSDRAQLRLTNSEISDNPTGLTIGDSAFATVDHNLITSNSAFGICVPSPEAQVQGAFNVMRDNAADLCGYAPSSLRQPLVPLSTKTQLAVPGDFTSLQEAIDAIVAGGTITISAGTYQAGLTLWKPVILRGAGADQTKIRLSAGRLLAISGIAEANNITIEGLTITGGKVGLLLYSQTTLENVRIANNTNTGLVVWGAADVQMKNSVIEANGNELDCREVTDSCNGVIVGENSHLVITDSLIKDNADWGLASALKECHVGIDNFEGEVVFMGNNVFEGNNQSGKLNGQGNPGHHPFQNLPDGQVCLP